MGELIRIEIMCGIIAIRDELWSNVLTDITDNNHKKIISIEEHIGSKIRNAKRGIDDNIEHI